MIGLGNLNHLESFDIGLSHSLEQLKFAEKNFFTVLLKRFGFFYMTEIPFSELKTEIYHSFVTFLSKNCKESQPSFMNQLFELQLAEVLIDR